MTPEDRVRKAEEACGEEVSAPLRAMLAAAIREERATAIAEEREACAQVAERWASDAGQYAEPETVEHLVWVRDEIRRRT